MAGKQYRPSFYLTINSLFVLLIICISGVLTWHNYRTTRHIVLRDAGKAYDQVARVVSEDFTHTYRPVFQAVGFLAMTPVLQARSFEARLAQLEVMGLFLQNQPEVAAIQVGYGNGDYFIVRSLRTEAVRTLMEAPDTAAYVADHIDAVGGKRRLLRLYFDAGLREIGRREPVATEYDPRARPWYKKAMTEKKVSAVAPYLFYFLREIGTTISYRAEGADAVVAADVTMHQVSETLARHLLTRSTEIVLLDRTGQVLAYRDPDKVIVPGSRDQVRLAAMSELGSDVLTHVASRQLLQPGPLSFTYNGERWQGEVRTLNVSGVKGRDLILLMISPASELLAHAIAMARRSLLITLGIILLSIPLVSLVAAFISRALNRLAGEAALISRFDFSRPIDLRSRIREVDELACSMDLMKGTISRFLTLIQSLAGEQNFDAMLEQITGETLKVSGADGVLTYLYNEDAKSFVPGALFSRTRGRLESGVLAPVDREAGGELTRACTAEDIHHVQIGSEHPEFAALLELFGTDELLASILPLRDRKSEVIGLLCLLNRADRGDAEAETWEQRLDFVRTFSGFAAVSLESRQLLEMQKRLMDSFMHLLAGAIDAKSAYTGGHCQRVPVITKMLARAACDDTGRYRDFQLDEEGWEAVHLAGWLHDCGKVTTPEYVVDKATKLETIYDRIHEIRTRFEVLKRDAEIRFWQKVAEGGDRDALRPELERELRELDDDFAFVAQCNVGGEFMAQEHLERLERIAGRTWFRTLDDRIGISWEEAQRKARTPAPDLPVEEPLLADRPDHLIERAENDRLDPENPWGFKLDMPEYLYNQGELYNLGIARGTLTAEERYKINDHIVQTIIMLEKLPYPKHLRKVPELAGGHHETMDGRGYPRRLTGDQMSLTARMMAIADIFEALTASDRPYKKAKTLSEALKIMSFMKEDHHIDPDLFELFLRSGVYLQYAREYLDPAQIDEVDIEQYLS